MTRPLLHGALAALVLTLCCSPSLAQTRPASIEANATQSTARVNGTSVGYRRFGSGPTTVVLLHGWPQSSREWDQVAPTLARRYTVIAVDLRGVGASAAPPSGYDKATMAADVHALVGSLGRKRVYVLGHDIGGMVAYAYARQFPADLLGVGVFDVPLPGIEPWAQIRADPRSWHFGFHQEAGLAENLVAGRQRIYFRDFYDRLSARPGAITEAELEVFARAYDKPAALKAGFEWYRAFSQDEAFNKARSGPLQTPMLLMGGDRSMGPLLPSLKVGLEKAGVADVRTVVVPGSGHWLAEEKPAEVVAAIDSFIAATATGPKRSER